MTTDEIADLILARATRRPGRFIVALAGAPGSGKSTLADRLADLLAKRGHPAEVVPMDGFHLDNRIIAPRGLLPRKGAPETFDLDGFHSMMSRLRAGDPVVAPVFDRDRDIAIAGARVIGADSSLLIVEGNYLAFDESGWRDLRPLWDLTLFLDVPLATLETRLVQRWLDQGLSPDAARARAEGNDLPNARRILAARQPVDVIVSEGT